MAIKKFNVRIVFGIILTLLGLSFLAMLACGLMGIISKPGESHFVSIVFSSVGLGLLAACCFVTGMGEFKSNSKN